MLPQIILKKTSEPLNKSTQRVASETSVKLRLSHCALLSPRNQQPKSLIQNDSVVPKSIDRRFELLRLQQPQEARIKQKVWLIRRIGDLLGQDTKAINQKRKRMKKKLNNKFKQFEREADTLLNLINEEGSFVDGREHRRLRQTLR